jgi:hypothetical protein
MMGLKEFRLLKKNLIASMKIETKKIPTIEKKIDGLNSTIKKQASDLHRKKEILRSAEKTTPFTQSEIDEKHEEMMKQEQELEQKKISFVPRGRAEVITWIIGSLSLIVLVLYAEWKWEVAWGVPDFMFPSIPDLMFIVAICLLLGYPFALMFWYFFCIWVSIPLDIYFEVREDRDWERDCGTSAADRIMEWPPFIITRRTYSRLKNYRQWESDMEDLRNKHLADRAMHNKLSDAQVSKVASGAKKSVVKAEKVLESTKANLETAVEEISELRSEQEKLLQSVAHMIPYASEIN